MFFHVFSYFTKNDYLRKVFQKLNKITSKKGIVVFDYWNSEYIKSHPLKDSVREVSYNNLNIKRHGKIKEIKKNIFKVIYNFEVKKDNEIKKKSSETHLMRSFSKKQILELSKKFFEIKKIFSFNNSDQFKSNNFSECIVLRKLN